MFLNDLLRIKINRGNLIWVIELLRLGITNLRKSKIKLSGDILPLLLFDKQTIVFQLPLSELFPIFGFVSLQVHSKVGIFIVTQRSFKAKCKQM